MAFVIKTVAKYSNGQTAQFQREFPEGTEVSFVVVRDGREHPALFLELSSGELEQILQALVAADQGDCNNLSLIKAPRRLWDALLALWDKSR